ncbi:MAG: DegT/DnrJ/EryC1/StrS family aminotransferase [Gemmatimonadota bacterium]|jgi:dTDP-4-amino-4,6-dideoxygalactose transaminase
MSDGNQRYIVFGQPHFSDAEIDEVVDSLRSGWVGTGPKVARFEEAFASYLGARHAVAVNSCTAGLHLAMLVAGVGPGDEVITTTMTFVSTVNAILHAGATPVLVDCDPETGLILPEQAADAVTPRTRAIVPVHLYGRPCPMDAINEIAQRHGLIVIEDAAHAAEAVYHGRKIGTIGDLTCFSFYATKNLTTGEGGMITTARTDLASRLKVFALHGLSRDAWSRFSDNGYLQYQTVDLGFKYNMMDLQAGLGLHQIPLLPERLRRREEIWRSYDEAFAGLPVVTPPPPEPDTVHARHLYTLLVDPETSGVDRDAFMRRLHAAGIGTGIHYLAVHLHQYYRERFGYRPQDYPNARWLSERTVSIPLSPHLTDEETTRIQNAVAAALEERVE